MAHTDIRRLLNCRTVTLDYWYQHFGSFFVSSKDIFTSAHQRHQISDDTMKNQSEATMKILSLLCFFLPVSRSYEPTWDSLDSRPLPSWYQDAKFGIFLHWGVFSVPSFGSEWFWNYLEGAKDKRYIDFIAKTEGPLFSYQDYAQRFDASLYRPDEWADIFAQAGAQYVVLTSKHHEGYNMWDSRDVPTTQGWNVMDVGPKRDLLGDLAKEVKNRTSPQTHKKVKFGVYHSMFEWYNLLYTRDQKNNYTTNDFVTQKTLPELYDLVKKYEPEIIWSDGAWDTSSDYWQSRDFLAWLATESQVKETVVWNDRWGTDAMCHHGSFLTCNDRFQPDSLMPQKWENCYTVDRTSWGLNRNASIADFYSTGQLIETLIATVALNGNLLLNVGPAADGTLHPIFVDRLLGIGQWLQVNDKAIYETRPWSVAQHDKNASVYYTRRKNTVYAIMTEWHSTLHLMAPKPSSSTKVQMLGVKGALPWTTWSTGMVISVPHLTPNKIPCQHAWVFALSDLENAKGLNKVRGVQH